ncbi:MAG: sigma 54-interacting transcriptional regulator [Planctomycetaceae bacterium]|jgi:transcriptional regulator with GAF, ATPase, and Fis domain|nr:sigma 54-interacting transcriptional regulator [Planctomycetaceae bacterium]
MPHQTIRFLELWKTAGLQNRLEDALPFLLQGLSYWGVIRRILVLRWESELGYVEPLIDYSPDKNDVPLSRRKCDSAVLAELKLLYNGQPATSVQNITHLPIRFVEQFSLEIGEHNILCLSWLKHRKQPFSETLLLIDFSPRYLLENTTEKKQKPQELNAVSFHEYFLECTSVLGIVLERETAFRRLSQLRETADAEKEAILTRLGRRDFSSEIIIGAGQGLRRVLERVDLIAATNSPAILFGESGSGKAFIARAIHYRSSFASNPFLRINCGAIPRELMDAQLFGMQPPGAFLRTNNGTIFLDDIHTLTVSAQIRLLQILENGVLEPIGANTKIPPRTVPIEIRVIAATDNDLRSYVSESQFNEELWYKLSAFPIRLPSLRERLDDMPELAKHFAERAATRFGLPLVLPNARDIEFLKQYSWPGNIRELATVIDRAALLGNGKTLDIATALGVPNRDSHRGDSFSASGKRRTHDKNRWAAFQSVEPFELLEKRYLEYVLAVTQGRIEGEHGAAELLEINPNTLRSRLKRLGIETRIFKNENGSVR